MVTHIRSMYIGGYRRNYKGVDEKFTYQTSINIGRMSKTQGA